MKAFLVWLAQGFGVGRIPVAPGTFGSLVGLLWFALLLTTGTFWGLALGTLAGVILSVWLCDVAEKALEQKDPGSVVWDEIAAVPVCFLGWVALVVEHVGTWPDPHYFLSKQNWLPTLGVFLAFRFFDVTKPWPARQSQALPGGWGITVDDLLAAVYVNAVVVAIWGACLLLAR